GSTLACPPPGLNLMFSFEVKFTSPLDVWSVFRHPVMVVAGPSNSSAHTLLMMSTPVLPPPMAAEVIVALAGVQASAAAATPAEIPHLRIFLPSFLAPTPR